MRIVPIERIVNSAWPGGGDGEYCEAQSAQGFLCTEAPGHQDVHIARGSESDEIFEIWGPDWWTRTTHELGAITLYIQASDRDQAWKDGTRWAIFLRRSLSFARCEPSCGCGCDRPECNCGGRRAY